MLITNRVLQIYLVISFFLSSLGNTTPLSNSNADEKLYTSDQLRDDGKVNDQSNEFFGDMNHSNLNHDDTSNGTRDGTHDILDISHSQMNNSNFELNDSNDQLVEYQTDDYLDQDLADYYNFLERATACLRKGKEKRALMNYLNALDIRGDDPEIRNATLQLAAKLGLPFPES